MSRAFLRVSGENSQRAVFLDRDGVINRLRTDHVKSLEELVLLPGATQAIARLSHAGWAAVVVTNQAGVNKGLVGEETLADIHNHIAAAVEASGGKIVGTYYCPHREEEACACRKPQPGLLLQAAEELGLSLSDSYLVGDSFRDMAAADAAGCIPILLGQRNWAGPPLPAKEVNSLAEAAEWILEKSCELCVES